MLGWLCGIVLRWFDTVDDVFQHNTDTVEIGGLAGNAAMQYFRGSIFTVPTGLRLGMAMLLTNTEIDKH